MADYSSFAARGVWCGVGGMGWTRESVAAYVDKIQRAGINALFVHLKGGNGLLYWPSALFPEAVASGYNDFDLPAALLEERRKRGVQFHAWMIDYYEGERGAAYRAHPEWAMQDAAGRTTSEEILRGKRFGALWMCPA
ncbi:MAG: hypothetical protein IT210_02080 [Armatimonadetes bacterium]|nr:hypothetical protein [Armatimonadota bacterium]